MCESNEGLREKKLQRIRLLWVTNYQDNTRLKYLVVIFVCCIYMHSCCFGTQEGRKKKRGCFLVKETIVASSHVPFSSLALCATCWPSESLGITSKIPSKSYCAGAQMHENSVTMKLRCIKL